MRWATEQQHLVTADTPSAAQTRAANSKCGQRANCADDGQPFENAKLSLPKFARPIAIFPIW